jgi:hypothetical protein
LRRASARDGKVVLQCCKVNGGKKRSWHENGLDG